MLFFRMLAVFGTHESRSGATMCARMSIPRTSEVRAFENEFSATIRTFVSLSCVVPGEEGFSWVYHGINERFASPAFDGNPSSYRKSFSLLRGLYAKRIFVRWIVSERYICD